MSDNSKIEWTDATWNPVIGCDKVSAGCDNCYAIRTAHRMSANPNPKIASAYAGTEQGGEWTGTINMLEERLTQPIGWTRPRRIFVNAQSDLFHKGVTDKFIARIFAVMALTPQHTYQVLTKRPGRMRSLLNSPDFSQAVRTAAAATAGASRRTLWQRWDEYQALAEAPLPNVHIGVSVENQATANLRIPLLLETPAALRFLSMEPLLGPVQLADEWMHPNATLCAPSTAKPLPEEHAMIRQMGHRLTRNMTGWVGWVIVGGESGPGARPMHPDWPSELRDQCVNAGIPFHFKQWGEWAPADYYPATHLIQVNGQLVDRKSATVENPYGYGSGTQDLVDRGHPGWRRIKRVGKALAGRRLDGRTWDETPS